MNKQEAAIQQMRETLIASGTAHAERLRYVRSIGKDYNIAVSTSGGLAIIVDDNNLYRFGPVYSNRVQGADAALVARWNRQAPNHPVEMVGIQRALESECSRIFLLIAELEKIIRRMEDGA